MAICGSTVVLSFKDDATPTPAYQVVAGFKTQGISLNREMVDVTNGSSAGRHRELLGGCGVKSASITGEGTATSHAALTAIQDAYDEGETREAKIFFPTWGTYEGFFQVTSLEIKGDHDDGVSFSFTLESAGEFDFTAA